MRKRMAGIALLSAVVIAGHLAPVFDSSAIENGVRNSLHILIFAIFAAAVLGAMRRMATARAVLVTFLLVAVVAGFSEVLQYVSGTRPDLRDIARDLAGATLGLISRHLWEKSRHERTSGTVRFILRASASLAVALMLAPLMYWLTVIGLSRASFPAILGFDHWWETYLFTPINAEITVSAGAGLEAGNSDSAARMHLTYWGRSGIGISPARSDWRDYKYLTFAARMAAGPDTAVTVRINDSARENNFSDRFIARIQVTADANVFRIPLDGLVVDGDMKPIDLSDIREIVIFARDRRRNAVMLLDQIRLQ